MLTLSYKRKDAIQLTQLVKECAYVVQQSKQALYVTISLLNTEEEMIPGNKL